MADIQYSTCFNALPPVEELYLKWTGHEPNWNKIQINSYWFMAKINGRVIGALQLLIVCDPVWNRNWGLVENVFVDPDYRKYGIAKKMMGKAELQATVLDCEFIKLTSGYNKMEGHALYRSLGYKEGLSFRKVLKID